MKILGIDGQAGMKLIFGTTVAGEKGKVGKEDKVIFCFFLFFFFKKKKKKVLGFLGLLVAKVHLGCVLFNPGLQDLGLRPGRMVLSEGFG
jgi:hypothetical protein